MNKKVCFIGHRKIISINVREKLKEEILKKIKNGYKIFTMGTHGLFDEMALSVCRELRKDHPIEIEVVITSFNKIKKIVEHDEIFGDEIYIPYSDVTTIMYDIEETYFKKQIIESNHQMIDTCDTLICYVDKKLRYSGAKYAYLYAKKKGLEIINIFEKD